MWFGGAFHNQQIKIIPSRFLSHTTTYKDQKVYLILKLRGSNHPLPVQAHLILVQKAEPLGALRTRGASLKSS